jgi:predicted transposase YbfD/YdcC
LNGALVTIDAMGTQKQIAQQIIEQQADYVLALKGNQGNLHEDVTQLFQYALTQQFKGIGHDYLQTTEQGHGRIETRRYWVMGQTEYLLDAEQWSGLNSIGCVEAQRQAKGKTTTLERRYYILSIPPDATRFAEAVRSHWGIENQLHWILDVGFREDSSRGCQGHSAENLAVIRHLAVNLLSQEKTAKGGIHTKRLKAGWNEDYLIKLLSQGSTSASII